jgi:hypothetical protein
MQMHLNGGSQDTENQKEILLEILLCGYFFGGYYRKKEGRIWNRSLCLIKLSAVGLYQIRAHMRWSFTHHKGPYSGNIAHS